MRANTQTVSAATVAATEEGRLTASVSALLLGALLALLVSLGSFATLYSDKQQTTLSIHLVMTKWLTPQ